jgi:hypothetical protein
MICSARRPPSLAGDGLTTHTFKVRRGGHNPTREQWQSVRQEMTEWFPGCRLEIEIETGEMGPFGVRIAGRISLSLIDGPKSRGAASELLRKALTAAGRPDLLEPAQD